MPRAHKPTQGSLFSIRAHGNYRIPDPPCKLEDMDPEVRAWVVENNRYVRAGAGKRTKAGLCLGYDGKVLCTKNAKSSSNSYCHRHQKILAGSLPVRRGGTAGQASPLRKLTAAEVSKIRESKRRTKISNSALAKIYEVSPAAISNIVRYHTYKNTHGGRQPDW